MQLEMINTGRRLSTFLKMSSILCRVLIKQDKLENETYNMNVHQSRVQVHQEIFNIC